MSDTAEGALRAAAVPQAADGPRAPTSGPQAPANGPRASGAGRGRPFRFRDGLKHSLAAHLLVFAALFLTGVGPEPAREPPRREVLVAVLAPQALAPPDRPERERELDTALPPEPELVAVEPESRPPLPEPELAEISDPRELVRRLPLAPLARLDPPPAEQPPDPAPPDPAPPDPAEVAPVPEPPALEPTPPAPISVAERRPARLLSSQAPAYPLASYRLGHEGAVLLRILVARDGSVLDVELVESSGYERLDQAALAAVRRWRFQPASEDGASVADAVLHRVVFRIES